MSDKSNNNKPGEGIRSLRSSTAFRVINFELYAKPCLELNTCAIQDNNIESKINNIVIMGLGLTCFGIALGYIAYMRNKYESMGYYAAVGQDGKEIFEKKKSKWD